MPDVIFPQIDINKIDLNKAAADINNAIMEGAYVAVGLGVLGFQRAQVRRVEFTKQLESQLAGLGELPTALSAQVESYRKQAISQAEQFGEQLSENLAAIGKLIDSQAEVIRQQLSVLAKTLDERVRPAREQLDQQFDRLEERLPEGAKTVVQTVRAAASAPEQLFRTAAGL